MGGALAVALASFLVTLAEAAPAAKKSGTFEEAAAAARPVGDLRDLVSPLFAECKSDDELEARQCREVRDWLLAERHGATFVGFGDESAISFAPYDASEKKLELEISGCLACGKPIKLDADDRPRFVTTRVPRAIKSGKAIGLDIGFDEVVLPDEKAAQSWQKKMGGRLRVEFVFRLGPTWKSGSFEGVTFVPLAHRVIDRCTGKVIASDPPSTTNAPAAPDDRCPVEMTDDQQRAADEAKLPEQLSPLAINEALARARGRAHDCYNEFEVPGTVVARLVINRSGKFDSITIQPPFDKTPTGYCVRTALQSVTLPRFRGATMIVNYPFVLK